MSYVAELLVLKRKKFNEEMKFYKSKQMEYSYVDFFETCLYLIENEKDDYVSEKYGRHIINGNGSGYKLFQEFFVDVENGSWTIVDKEQYIKLYEWIENKIKQPSLYDIGDPETAWEYLYSFRKVKYELDNIDFNNEFVVFFIVIDNKKVEKSIIPKFKVEIVGTYKRYVEVEAQDEDAIIRI